MRIRQRGERTPLDPLDWALAIIAPITILYFGGHLLFACMNGHL